MRGKKRTRAVVVAIAALSCAAAASPAVARGGRAKHARSRHEARAAERLAAVKDPASRRDPFLPLFDPRANALPMNLPPGKAGLIIGRLRLEGLVDAPNGMLAVVATPQGRVFFLRAGDQLYDGTVLAVGRASATFRQLTRDAYGRSLTRTVTLGLHSGKGE